MERWDSRRFLVTVVADPSSLSVRELKHQMPNLFGLVVSFETTFHVDLVAILSTMTLASSKKVLNSAAEAKLENRLVRDSSATISKTARGRAPELPGPTVPNRDSWEPFS